MSVIVTSCRAPAVVAGPSRQQQPRTAAVRQPLRPCRSALCFRQAAVRQAQPLAAARRQVLAVRAQSGGEPKASLASHLLPFCAARSLPLLRLELPASS